MSRIMEAWENLLREAISKDYDEQQNAVFQIGLVLQRHNPKINPESDMIEEGLSRDLLRLSLNESRQSDTVIYLAELVRNHPKDADSFLYALGNAQAHILVEPLLMLLQDVGTKLKTDGVYQALMAVDGLFRSEDEAVMIVLEQYDLNDLLKDWAEYSDELVSSKAKQIIRRLGA